MCFKLDIFIILYPNLNERRHSNAIKYLIALKSLFVYSCVLAAADEWRLWRVGMGRMEDRGWTNKCPTLLWAHQPTEAAPLASDAALPAHQTMWGQYCHRMASRGWHRPPGSFMVWRAGSRSGRSFFMKYKIYLQPTHEWSTKYI